MVNWPKNKKFAFTIVDDTDKATVENIKPVYDYLYKSGVITTKTVWALPSRDKFGGESLSDDLYKLFIQDLASKGFEIGFHGAGSGNFNRDETLMALEIVRESIGKKISMHINHAWNSDNLYWQDKRFTFPLNLIYRLIRKFIIKREVKSLGDEEGSCSFWGDVAKKEVKYIRNRVFSGLNTLKNDKYMPYKERAKERYSNYWFSSSDGVDCNAFVNLLSRENIDKLERENGCAIVYTHFAYGFVNEKGELDKQFKECIDYLVSKDGWFVPATEVLDYINDNRKKEVYLNSVQGLSLDFKWFIQRIRRKLFGGV